ncbi:Peroxisomal membrane protein PEX16 [Schizosaccharomyces pombe]
MKPLAYYEDQLLKDEKSFLKVTEIERLLSYAAYLLPAEFRDDQLKSQTITSILLLLHQFHTGLLFRKIAELPKTEQAILKSERTQYLEYFRKKNPSFEKVSELLYFLNISTFPIELVISKYNPSRQYDSVLFLESVKFLLRVHIMWTTGGDLPLSNPVLQRDFNVKTFIHLHKKYSNSGSAVVLKNSKKVVPRLNTVNSSLDFLQNRTPRLSSILPDEIFTKRLPNLRIFSNFIKVCRPLIYMLFMWHWKRKQKSGSLKVRPWGPWIVAFVFEVISQLIDRRCESATSSRQGFGLERRTNQSQFQHFVVWAFTQGRFYDEFTKHWINRSLSWVNSIPVFGKYLLLSVEERQKSLENYISSVRNY